MPSSSDSLKCAVATLALLCVAFAAPSPAATIRVTSATDDPLASDSRCSLREAVLSANSGNTSGACTPGDAGADVIELTLPGPYELSIPGATASSGDLDISGDLTIRPAGAATAIIDATGVDRVIEVLDGDVRLERLVITGGHAPDGANGAAGQVGGNGADGGGIFSHGSGELTLVGVAVTDNTAGAGGSGGDRTALGPPAANGGIGGHGGGIWSASPLVLRNSSVIGNASGAGGAGGNVALVAAPAAGGIGRDGGDGGGIYSIAATLTITGSAIDDNVAGAGGAGGVGLGGLGGSAGDGGSGGGLVSSADLDVSSSSISGNRASAGGRGGFGGPPGSAGAAGSGGGARLAGGAARFDGAVIEGNAAGKGGDARTGPLGPASAAPGGAGGGIAQGGGAVVLTDSTIAGNHAGNGGQGSFDTTFGFAMPATGGAGGGVAVGAGALRLVTSTVRRNTAGNGAGFPGGLVDPFGSAGGDGGGLHNAGALTIVNSTIGDNAAGDGADTIAAAGAPGGRGGALYSAANASLESATIGANESGRDGASLAGPGALAAGGGIAGPGPTSLTAVLLAGNSPQNCDQAAGVADQLHNLDFPDSACPGIGGDPLLSALLANGGGTLTQLIGTGSAAIDKVPLAACRATDQRGVTRPQGVACDIGAVEFVPPAAPSGGGAPGGGGGSATPDLRRPSARLRFARQSLSAALARGLAALVSTDEPGTARLEVFAGKVRVARRARTFTAVGERRVVAKFTAAAKRRLRPRRRIRLLVRLTVTDAAGNRAAVSGRPTIRR